jgi:hypothetical protein
VPVIVAQWRALSVMASSWPCMDTSQTSSWSWLHKKVVVLNFSLALCLSVRLEYSYVLKGKEAVLLPKVQPPETSPNPLPILPHCHTC